MEKKKTDLRFIRTEKMLKDAFIELMETVGFQKISIEELTKRAFISRKTFYLHYLDKFDMLDHIEDELVMGIDEIIRPIPEMIQKGGFVLGEDSTQQHLKIYLYIQEHARLVRLLFSEKGDPAFINKLEAEIKQNFQTGYLEGTWKIPDRYAVTHFAVINAGLIKEWVVDDMEETPEEMAEITTILVQGFIDACRK